MPHVSFHPLKSRGFRNSLPCRVTRVPTQRSPWAEAPTPHTWVLVPGPRQEGRRTLGEWELGRRVG